jgi:hypothetical protein
MYAGVGLFVAGILIGAVLREEWPLTISLPAFAVAFVVAVTAQFFGLHHGGFRVPPQVRFCPYCGVNLNEKLLADPFGEPGQEAGPDDSTPRPRQSLVGGMVRVSFRDSAPDCLSGRARKAFQLANQEAYSDRQIDAVKTPERGEKEQGRRVS